MNNNERRPARNEKQRVSVNTTANLKKAGVKKAIRTSGKATGFVLNKSFQWILNIFLTLLLILTISGIAIVAAFFGYVNTYLIERDFDIEDLKTNLNQTTKIYYTDASGNDVEMVDQRIYGTENRSWVSYGKMPENLTNAFVAIEDERYWKHSGVDWKRTFGAVLQFVGGNDSYGGSTITQQLIKNVTQESETTIQRKVKEIFRALTLTKKHSKEEVLEMYLNTINLSRNNYGVQAASNYYFGKDVSQLELVECAALAAIPKSPTKYDPVRNPEENKRRRNTVLAKMEELGWITPDECEAAQQTELVINITVLDGTVTKSNSYFKDALIEQLIADLKEEYGYSREYASGIIYSGGLKIYATIDPEIQTIMEEVFSDPSTFQRVSEGIQPESAMVLMDPYTGDVKGLVGGREKTGNRDLNRATQSRRQIGSAIKPITVYAPAMDLGLINYATVIDDTPVEYMPSKGRYWPKNSPNRYDGLVTVNRALEVSKNTVSVKVLEMLTPDYSYNFSKNKLHLDNLVTSDKDLSPLALGGLTNGLTVMEVTAAYSIFPSGGTYSAPRLYTKVLRNDDTVLLERNVDQEAVISQDTAQVMTKILQNVVTNGTASRITLDKKVNVAGKTGTTNDDKDRYFVGYTPYYVGACWFGYDIPKYLGKFSSNPAMIAWEKVMERVHEKCLSDASAQGEPVKQFDFSRLTQTAVCLDSGFLPSEECNHDLRGSRITYAWFAKEQVPTKTCPTHIYVDWDSTTGQVATPYCPSHFIMRVAFINVEDRNFVQNIPITDARYTARASAQPYYGATDSFDPYYFYSMPIGMYPGYTPGISQPQNSYCSMHQSHSGSADGYMSESSGMDSGFSDGTDTGFTEGIESGFSSDINVNIEQSQPTTEETGNASTDPSDLSGTEATT